MHIELVKIDWDNLNDMPVTYAYEDFTGNIIKIIEVVAPNVKMTIKSFKVIRDPWITKGLMTLSVTDGKLYHRSIGKSTMNIKII